MSQFTSQEKMKELEFTNAHSYKIHDFQLFTVENGKYSLYCCCATKQPDGSLIPNKAVISDQGFKCGGNAKSNCHFTFNKQTFDMIIKNELLASEQAKGGRNFKMPVCSKCSAVRIGHSTANYEDLYNVVFVQCACPGGYQNVQQWRTTERDNGALTAFASNWNHENCEKLAPLAYKRMRERIEGKSAKKNSSEQSPTHVGNVVVNAYSNSLY